MGNQVNPVGAYWLLDFMVGRLLQEHEVMHHPMPSSFWHFGINLGEEIIITVSTEYLGTWYLLAQVVEP